MIQQLPLFALDEPDTSTPDALTELLSLNRIA